MALHWGCCNISCCLIDSSSFSLGQFLLICPYSLLVKASDDLSLSYVSFLCPLSVTLSQLLAHFHCFLHHVRWSDDKVDDDGDELSSSSSCVIRFLFPLNYGLIPKKSHLRKRSSSLTVKFWRIIQHHEWFKHRWWIFVQCENQIFVLFPSYHYQCTVGTYIGRPIVDFFEHTTTS